MKNHEKMNDEKYVVKQYSDDSALNIRKRLHEKYSVNKKSFGTWIFEQYDLPIEGKILELGSGNGDMWQAHIDEICKKSSIILSDFSGGMVDILRNKYQSINIEIKKINIQNIPFDDNSFDVVIANAMLYHVPNLEKAIKEVKRILKPGGKFYASTFGENGLSKYINDSLNEINLVSNSTLDFTFTLQNGQSSLVKYFDKVNRIDYVDMLKVTETEDLVDYICSMTLMQGLENHDRDKMLNYFNKKKDRNGVIEIPKEYGTFVSTK